MTFDPTKPAQDSSRISQEIRDNFQAMNDTPSDIIKDLRHDVIWKDSVLLGIANTWVGFTHSSGEYIIEIKDVVSTVNNDYLYVQFTDASGTPHVGSPTTPLYCYTVFCTRGYASTYSESIAGVTSNVYFKLGTDAFTMSNQSMPLRATIHVSNMNTYSVNPTFKAEFTFGKYGDSSSLVFGRLYGGMIHSPPFMCQGMRFALGNGSFPNSSPYATIKIYYRKILT